MRAVEVHALASQLGVSLAVDGEREKIIATPTRNVTEELRDGVKSCRDELLRSLTIQGAIEWVWRNQSGSGSLKEINDSIPYEDVSDMSFREFRAALWRWARGMVDGMRAETLSTEEEVFQAFREVRDGRGMEAVA